MTQPNLLWLAGDHHVHTHYSHDGTYSVARQAEAGAQHGLAWLVVTDHGGPDHAKLAVGPTSMDVERARIALPQLLVFQGVEWNVPGSEHGTVFIAPSRGDRELLERFEQLFDGFALYGDGGTNRTVRMKALEGLSWMQGQVVTGRTPSALFLINHPSRRGLVSPQQLRDWHDLCPDVAVGMEGAPGHQDAGQRCEPRGIYDKGPTVDSYDGYPAESYRTMGGFDWMTATVGGVWDSLLAEGRRWWVTANSDSHAVASGPGSRPFGRDFWPGAYSRTVVGVTRPTYRAVMDGIRRGRMWVVHGDLIWSLDVRVGRLGFIEREGVTLGGRLVVERGDDVSVRMSIGLPKTPNASGALPGLARVDVIFGPVMEHPGRSDAIAAPETAVVGSFDIRRQRDEVGLDYTFRSVERSFYLRLRGTDGNFCATGSLDPLPDHPGIDPWSDLWFYSNPVFVDVGSTDRP